MEVGKSNVLKFFGQQNVSFFIPVYQRPHAWGQKNCIKLLEDIVSIAKGKSKTHFLGSITYVSHEKGGYHECTIIDGQQRITSIMLLLKALQTCIQNDEIKAEINKLINLDSESKLRLKPSERDEESFSDVMKNSNMHNADKKGVKANYLCFEKNLLRYLDILEAIYRAFEKLEIVLISLENGKDDPQRVFESINGTGVGLSGVDLIRNHLLMEQNPAEQKRLYDEYWKPIEELDKEKRETFIKNYLRIYMEEKVKDQKDELYDAFKEHKKKQASLEDLMSDMRDYTRIYKVLIDLKLKIETPIIKTKQAKKLRDKINIINHINFGVSYPFIMRLVRDFEQGKLTFEDFDGMLQLLLSYYIRREICGLDTQGLNKMMYALYRRLDSVSFDGLARFFGKQASEPFPSDEDVSRCFAKFKAYKNKSKICKIVLFEIEKSSNHELPSIDALEIEHIYPQDAREWRQSVGSDADEIENIYLHTFGNLSLLVGELNKEVSNKPFKTKTKIIEEKGSLHLNRYFLGKDAWGLEEILKRNKHLADKFCKIELFKDLPEGYHTTTSLKTQHASKTLADNLTYLKASHIHFRDGTIASINNNSMVFDVAKAVISYLYQNHKGSFERFIEDNQSDKKPIVFWGKSTREVKKTQMCVEFDDIFYFWVSSKSFENVGRKLREMVHACGLNPRDFVLE